MNTNAHDFFIMSPDRELSYSCVCSLGHSS